MADISTFPLWARSMIAHTDSFRAAQSGNNAAAAAAAAAMVKRHSAEIRADPPLPEFCIDVISETRFFGKDAAFYDGCIGTHCRLRER